MHRGHNGLGYHGGPIHLVAFLVFALACLATLLLMDVVAAEAGQCPPPGEIDGELFDQRAIWSSSTTEAVHALALEDLDGDGARDVVHCTADGSVTAYSPSKDRVLWQRTLAGATVHSFELGDVDGDGRWEVLVSTSTGLYCLEYGSPSVQWRVATLTGVHSLNLVDYNLNGTDAIFFLNHTTLHRYDGGGREVFNRTIDPVDDELGRLSMMVEDGDGDGSPEVMVTDSGWDWNGGGSVVMNGHHIWVFDCASGRMDLARTLDSGLFCSKPALVDVDGDRFMAIGLYQGTYDFVMYSIRTDTELTFDVFDNGDAVDWCYVATIPGPGLVDDRLLVASKDAVVMTWSKGSDRPDWSVEGNASTQVRYPPMVCDSDSDGRFEVLVPYGHLVVYDAGTGAVDGSFEIDSVQVKLDVLMSLGDTDGDGLSEICYGYYDRRAPAYRIVIIDSPACTVSLDEGVLAPPATLYPTVPRRFGFVIANMSANRLHYSLRFASENAVMGGFYTVEVSVGDAAVLSESGGSLHASGPTSRLVDGRVDLRFDLTPSWDFGHDGPNDITVQVLSQYRNVTTLKVEGVYSVERDLVLAGDVNVTSLDGRRLEDRSWVAPDEDLEFSAFEVVFEDATDVLPPWDAFLLSVTRGSETLLVNLSGQREFRFTTNVTGTGPAIDISVAIHQVPLGTTSPVQFSITLLIDGDPPTVTAAYPEESTWVVNRTVACQVHVLEVGSGIDVTGSSYALHLNGTLEGAWSPLGTASIVHGDGWVVVELETLFNEGVNQLVWNLTDGVGNHRQFVQVIQVDLTAVVFGDLSPTGWVRGLDALCSVEVSDANGSGVNTSSIQVSFSHTDSLSFSAWEDVEVIASGDRVTVEYEYHGVEGRTNLVRFRGRDKASERYSVSQTYRLWMDGSPPDVTVVSPANGTVLPPDDLEVSTLVVDNGSGLDEVTANLVDEATGNVVEISMTQVEVDGGGHWINITWIAPGHSFVLSLTCVDAVGNRASVEGLAFSVNQPPAVVIGSPAGGSVFKLGEEIAFVADIEDPDGDELSVTWLLDDSVVLSSEGTFAMSTIPTGSHNVTLVVYDDYHHVEVTVEISIVDDQDGNGGNGGDGGWPWFPLALVIFVLVALVGGYLWTRS